MTRSQPAATLAPSTPDLPRGSVGDVAAALAETINQVRTGRLAVNVANAVGVLAGVLIRALETAELEHRIAALEARHGRPGRAR